MSTLAPAPAAVRYVVRADARSGRLVRTVIAPPKPATPDPGVRSLVEDSARTYGVDPLLVHSVIEVESNYNQYAVSPKGAEGLMQLIPSTARRFGVTNSFDAKENIDAGVRYLKHLQSLFPDNLRLSLAAYNAGEGAVAKYKTVPPYRETEDYVSRVGKRYDELKGHAAPEPVSAPAVAAGAPEEEKHPPIEMYVDSGGRLYLRTR